jgi:2-polyprenyl-3-methyl-5-hydroxy-6-metoxy-1,4-benzoquinol methylase
LLKRLGKIALRKLPQNYIRQLHSMLAEELSTTSLEKSLIQEITSRSHRLEADEALRFLFRLDTDLYHLQGTHAVQYGGGVHTKHRHMGYHRFFVERISSTDHVLDIGCGIGTLAHSIVQKTGATLVGIDYDKKNIATAKEHYSHPNIDFEIHDIYSYTPGEKFSVVILSNVLEHLINRPHLLRDIAQKTSARRFLIRVPRFDRHWTVPLKQELGVEWRLDDDHKIEYTPETFQQEMQEASLQIQHIEFRWDEIWAELHVV